GYGLQLGDLDAADETPGLALLDPTRAELERRRRTGCDGEPQRLLVGAPVQPRGYEPGQQDVPGADSRDWVDARRQSPVAVLLDSRAPLVHLGVRAAGRVDDRRGGARVVIDPDEVVQDRFRRQLLDDPRPGAAAGETGRDDRHAEPLEGPRDIDPLAAGKREPLAGSVPLAALEVRNGQRPVDRRVHRDRDDQENHPSTWCRVRPAYHPARPARPGRS